MVTRLPDLVDRFRRRIKVEITCPCGSFIPSAHLPGRVRRFTCHRCGFEVRLSPHRGPATW